MQQNSMSYDFSGHFAPEAKALLDRHNAIWTARLDIWNKYAGAPWWGQGLVVSPELRGMYESFLPVREYISSICRVARAFFPTEEWLPYPLRNPFHLSLPDLWADLPLQLTAGVTVKQDDFFPLMCALADPPSFGTLQGRYPGQIAALKKIIAKGMRIADIGCGVGHNTLEIAKALENFSPVVIGVTGELLEVWMAQNRKLPHDWRRQMAFPDCAAEFTYGFAEDFCVKADVVVSNGLVGGRFLCSQSAYRRFLECCVRAGAEHVFTANRFHDGRRQALRVFMDTAREMGWNVHGRWNALHLCR